jgi:4-amino-4-deoxy-L-arabinose transferase-like glycosyltransferase
MEGLINKCIIINIISICLFALWVRTSDLGNLPGINGDEAWYGVQVSQIMAGRPFALRTPSGLPLNPFFVALEAPLLFVFQPSFWILRAPAVVLSVVAVVAVFVLGSRVLDRTTALLASLLLATLPPVIGYSRLGGVSVPGECMLLGILALYFAFRGKGLATLCSFVACVFIQPSNIFLFPALLALFVAALWRTETEASKRRQIVWMTGAIVLIPLVTWILITPGSERLSLLAARAAPSNWLRFLRHYGRLISGVSLNHFVVGPLSAQADTRSDGIFWSLFLTLLVLGVPRLVQRRQWDRIALIIGLILGGMALYLAVGPEILRPHRERYGLYLVIPTVLGAASLISSLLPDPDCDGSWVLRQACLAVIVLGAWGLLFSFKTRYLDAIKETGGESHVTFRTAAIEPKQQAFQRILDDLANRNPGLAQEASAPRSAIIQENQLGSERRRAWPVLAEDWWLYWPLRFLSSRHPEIAVISPEDDRFDPYDPGRPARPWQPFMTALSSGGYAVAFADGELERLISSSVPSSRRRQWDIQDYAGRRLISVFRVESEQ